MKRCIRLSSKHECKKRQSVKMPEPRMSPQELVGGALDAAQAGTNDETRNVYQLFTADPNRLR